MRSIAAPAESVASCFLNQIPAFVEPELARLYETLHSSLPFFELFRSTEAAHCYVSWHDGRPVHIFMFIMRGNCLEVLNEMIEVDEDELARFAGQVFARFGQVDLIRFRALKTVLRQFGFPFQRYGAKYTYCIEYKQRLGAELLGMGELKIYRSRWKMLANPQHAAGILLDARIRAGKEFLHRHRDHALAKSVFGSIYLLRNWGAK